MSEHSSAAEATAALSLTTLPDDALALVLAVKSLKADDLAAASLTCKRLRNFAEEEARRRIARKWQKLKPCTAYPAGTLYPPLTNDNAHQLTPRTLGTWLFDTTVCPIRRPRDSWICVLTRECAAADAFEKDNALFRKAFDAQDDLPRWGLPERVAAALTDVDCSTLKRLRPLVSLVDRTYNPVELAPIMAETNEYSMNAQFHIATPPGVGASATTTASSGAKAGTGKVEEPTEFVLGASMDDDADEDVQDRATCANVNSRMFFRDSYWSTNFRRWKTAHHSFQASMGGAAFPVSFKAFVALLRMCAQAILSIETTTDAHGDEKYAPLKYAHFFTCDYRESVLMARLLEAAKTAHAVEDVRESLNQRPAVGQACRKGMLRLLYGYPLAEALYLEMHPHLVEAARTFLEHADAQITGDTVPDDAQRGDIVYDGDTGPGDSDDDDDDDEDYDDSTDDDYGGLSIAKRGYEEKSPGDDGDTRRRPDLLSMFPSVVAAMNAAAARPPPRATAPATKPSTTK
eukprot:Opistho-1_new@70174